MKITSITSNWKKHCTRVVHEESTELQMSCDWLRCRVTDGDGCGCRVTDCVVVWLIADVVWLIADVVWLIALSRDWWRWLWMSRDWWHAIPQFISDFSIIMKLINRINRWISLIWDVWRMKKVGMKWIKGECGPLWWSGVRAMWEGLIIDIESNEGYKDARRFSAPFHFGERSSPVWMMWKWENMRMNVGCNGV
jgi:hypothetical protein